MYLKGTVLLYKIIILIFVWHTYLTQLVIILMTGSASVQ